MKAGKAPVGFRLAAVEKVSNPVLERRFALRQQAMKERVDNKCTAEELRERFAFHGGSGSRLASLPKFKFAGHQARIRST